MHDLLALMAGEFGDFLTVDLDRTFVRIENAEDTLQENGLAGAGSADDHDRFADPDIEIDAAKDMLLGRSFSSGRGS